ncbi:MAG: YafY family transcriptional regulator [Clostridiales bacterium]|nr:YafY family transcriptional regulator [Clostridiales bacterium]
MQINRLFEIVYILMNKSTVTAKELAERFEVSQRTIYRDVDALSLAGIPVYTSKGRGGGISLVEDFVLNKSILSDQEQSEILSALEGLAAVRTEDTAEVLEKLSSFFNKPMTSWVEVDFSDWSYQNGQIFTELKRAILERLVVEMTYFSTYGERTKRSIEPMQLWFKSKTWYVKAYCLSKQCVRTFKLTRIAELLVTGEHFAQRDLLKSIAQNEPITEKEADTTLTLRIAPGQAYRVYDDFGQTEVERLEDGSFLVVVRWPEGEWVYGMMLSYGTNIEVLAPAHIREILLQKAKKIVEIYS